MNRPLRFWICLCVAAACIVPRIGWGEESVTVRSSRQDQQEVDLTIYNDDLGLVKDRRRVRLETGRFTMEFADVAAKMDPTSVFLKSLTHPGELFILEQNYEFDLITPKRLLEKSVGKQVTLVRTVGKEGEEKRTEATLVSVNGGEVYRIGEEIHLSPPGRVILHSMPENLHVRPTLVWLLDNRGDRFQTIEVSYLTRGIFWDADYVAVLAPDDRSMDMTCWITLRNKSGTTYRDARVKLIAGEVHRVPRTRRRGRVFAAMKEAPGAPAVEEQPFFEYHLYTLKRPTTIKDNQIKQITFRTVDGIPFKTVLVSPSSRGYWGERFRSVRKDNPYVEMVFKNTKESRLGIPLPKGRFRVYKPDADQILQFIGEDRINHTSAGEEIRLRLGKAFDVVVERRQTDYKRWDKTTVQQTYSISVRNHKQETVTVLLEERQYGEWQIVRESRQHTRKDAFTIQYPVQVEAGQTETVTYTVLSKQ